MDLTEMMRKAELLSPAGDMECLEAALRFGADSVYVGGPFMQLRAKTAGFNEERLALAAQRAHAVGSKLYVTVNSFAKNDEIDRLRDYAKLLHGLGVDAAIVSDLGAISAMRESCPELEVHVSTQANCQNYQTAKVYRDMGATRVVLAREMSIEQIGELHSRLPDVELEAFVHGAMCMSYSGRCMMSTFMTGRSGNRGECAQPCRWSYRLVEEKRPGEYYPVEQYDDFLAVLSSGDLNCMDFTDELVKAGVSCLKIEGRMKSAYYVATVTNAYKLRLMGKSDVETLQRELRSVSHRPYTDGFYYGAPPERRPDNGEYIRECKFIANVMGRQGESLVVKQRNVFSVGDTVEVLRAGHVGESFIIESIKDAKGEVTERANHPMQNYEINCPYDLEEGDMLRVR